MGGPGCIVEIDESLFQGKRKYNRLRLLCSDQRTGNEENEEPLTNDETEQSAEETYQRNYGSRVQGPWIFGLCWHHNDLLERRFFIVQKRDRATLLPIIQREVEQGTIIHSDQWKAYATLNEHGFTAKTVNHSLNFIDPSTGAHTQSIEGIWRIVKKRYGIKVISSFFEWWQSFHPAMDTIFDDFHSDMKTSFLV